ncbi:MAG: D-glycero-beta-D-manno-heptose-7-phosphate kinase [Selenomonadaceae bacterium]|nr:D-glycero-beta-D-manno-heptose-7-phosphate kinase [Selenomonadaceae bacterium]
MDMLKNFVAEKINNCRVMVIGDVMLDKYYFGDVERISPEAPVPIAHVMQIKETLGGGANVVHNLALLGCQTSLVTQIGNDIHGDKLLQKFQSRGVDYSGVVRIDKPTTTKIRVISGHQQMIRLDFEDAEELNDVQTSEVLNKFYNQLPNVDAVIISDYGKGVCTEKICRAVIDACRQSDKFVVVDPKGDDWLKYSRASFITPNLKELNEVLPRKIKNVDTSVETSARYVIDKFNLDGLIVTRSSKGLTLVDGKNIAHIKARAQDVFDVSGAGDTVIAVFTLALAGGLDTPSAAFLANTAAGVVVAKVGTYAVSKDELLSAI